MESVDERSETETTAIERVRTTDDGTYPEAGEARAKMRERPEAPAAPPAEVAVESTTPAPPPRAATPMDDELEARLLSYRLGWPEYVGVSSEGGRVVLSCPIEGKPRSTHVTLDGSAGEARALAEQLLASAPIAGMALVPLVPEVLRLAALDLGGLMRVPQFETFVRAMLQHTRAVVDLAYGRAVGMSAEMEAQCVALEAEMASRAQYAFGSWTDAATSARLTLRPPPAAG